MICCVPGCQNDSKLKSQGVTFHAFPKQPSIHEAWLQVIGKRHSELSEKTLVCSEHFLYDDFYITKHGMRKLKPDAVPIVEQESSDAEEEILKVCRICLETEGEMYTMQNSVLQEAYQKLTGLSAVSEPYVPMQLCAECAHRAVGCSRLRDKALRAHRLVLNLLADHGALNKQNLCTINRLDNRLKSDLKVHHYPPNHADLCLVADVPIKREITKVKPNPIKMETSDSENDRPSNGSGSETDDKYFDFDTDYLQPEESSNESEDANTKNKKKHLENDATLVKDLPIYKKKRPLPNINVTAVFKKCFKITQMTYDEEKSFVENRKNSTNYRISPFKCTECFKGFKNEVPYRTHMTRHTNRYGEYQCDICKLHFHSRFRVVKHVTAHHVSRYNCKRCPYVTKNMTAAKRHLGWHEGKKYNCPHCPAVYDIFSTYMGHLRVKHPSNIICQLCGFSFVSEKGKEMHQLRKHAFDNLKIPKDGPLCKTCDIRFASLDALNQHVIVSDRHTEEEKDVIAPRRKIARLKGEKVESEHPKSLKCEQCGVKLKNLRDYAAHFKQEHSDKNRTYYPRLKLKYICEICGRVQQSPSQLADHRWSHTSKNPYSCDICGKAFKAKARLTVHRQLHDPNRASYACHLCGREFSHMSNRLRHIKLVHTTIKPHKCELCDKSFKSIADKRTHVTYVHLGKPWPKRNRARQRPNLLVTPKVEKRDSTASEGDGDGSE